LFPEVLFENEAGKKKQKKKKTKKKPLFSVIEDE